ncbi:MAG: hypothetical protein GVY32_00345 [Gammaproteobacteria bacterium]|jgi:hypothetical protein|nr:hypothetical protein [Gammaproteobacteria bacterium]
MILSVPKVVFATILIAIAAWPASASTSEIPQNQVWPAGAGSMTLEIRADYLPDFGLEVLQGDAPIETRERVDFRVDAIEPLRVRAPWGHLESLDQSTGRLAVRTGLTLRHDGRTLALDPLFLVPGEHRGHPQLVAEDEQGRELFRLTHMHILALGDRGRLSIANAEVVASGYMADALGLDALEGMPIALGWLELGMTVPDGAIVDGEPPSCSGRPIWPQEGQYEADVTLINMSSVAYQGTEPGTGRVKIAPSATLKNEGLADIPWYPQFSSPSGYPYDPADQHPFLVWNAYRVTENRIRMLADSGVKHAFLTINVNCTNCGSSNILWPECEDTYSSGNNDTSTYQGPRDEIVTSLGEWDNCGSFFDPGCTGNQTGFSGQWLNRLLIDPAEFTGDRGGTLYLDSWYVVKYDTDIWNTMGFRSFEPTPSGGGWSMNPGPYQQGPVISQWVAEDETDPMADHDVIVVPSETPGADYPGNMPQGHLRLLVKVSQTEPGRYRYNYALQNYDFDRAMEGFRIDLPEGTTVHDTFFGDIDNDADNDWTIEVNADHVLFEAPADNPLTWFTLFNFEIEVDAAPVDSQVTLDLGSDAVMPEMQVTTLGPTLLTELIFGDRFEPAPTD